VYGRRQTRHCWPGVSNTLPPQTRLVGNLDTTDSVNSLGCDAELLSTDAKAGVASSNCATSSPVSTAIDDDLWRSSEMTYIVSGGAVNSTHSLTHLVGLEFRRAQPLSLTIPGKK